MLVEGRTGSMTIFVVVAELRLAVRAVAVDVGGFDVDVDGIEEAEDDGVSKRPFVEALDVDELYFTGRGMSVAVPLT